MKTLIRMKTKYYIILFGILVGGLAISCSKMNDLHMDYLLEGERVYVGQPDSVEAAVGLNRVELRYWISDPKAKKIKIYWDNKLDSILLDIPLTATHVVKVVEIENLDPKSYNFQIITYNENWGNPSIPMDVICEVYSESYLKRLFPRRIEYATYLAEESVEVNFHRATEKSVESHLSYINQLGNTIKMIITNDTSFVLLDDFKENLQLYTSFLPFEDALDTLYSEPTKYALIDKKLDKSLFKRWNPTGIPYQDIGGTYSIEKMWDANLSSWFISGGSSGTKLPYPYDFTFDLGQEKRLTRFKQWQRNTASILYGEQQIRVFELWGSSSSDVTNDLSDWVLLGSFEVKKPPTGANLSEAAQKGHNFIIVGAPPVRYIRYRVLELFTNNGAMTLGEIEFFSPY